MNRVSIVAAAALLLAGCGPKVSGVYTGDADAYMDSLNFKSGDSVELRDTGVAIQTTYRVEGGKVKLVNALGEAVSLTIDGKCLVDEEGDGKYCRQ